MSQATGWTIWKFALPVDTDDFTVPLPAAVTLTVQLQRGIPVLWAAVMPATAEEGKRKPARFRWVGTGQPIPEVIKSLPQSFVGTVQLHGGDLVLHLFRVFE